MIKSVQLVTKTAKNGNEYKVLELEFVNGYKKIVFLEQAEQYILTQLANEIKK